MVSLFDEVKWYQYMFFFSQFIKFTCKPENRSFTCTREWEGVRERERESNQTYGNELNKKASYVARLLKRRSMYAW